MVALGVIELMVTDRVDAYVPATGLNVGAATTGRLIVYNADATVLSVTPVLYAMALIVSVAPTATAVLYTVPAVSLGVLPSVV
jgi:hypothetical protein